MPRCIEDAFNTRFSRSQKVHEGTMHFQDPGSRISVPVPPSGRCHKAYLYGSSAAQLTLNGATVRLDLGPDGFWEFVLNAVVHSLDVQVDAAPGVVRWVLVERL
jgi:hypothetical protein